MPLSTMLHITARDYEGGPTPAELAEQRPHATAGDSAGGPPPEGRGGQRPQGTTPFRPRLMSSPSEGGSPYLCRWRPRTLIASRPGGAFRRGSAGTRIAAARRFLARQE